MRMDYLDVWIKKIESSNKPYNIQPYLYHDIKKYINQAFLYDFNLMELEFPFFNELPSKIQTELVYGTHQFRQLLKHFDHFFEECENGFINEIIMKFYCKITRPGKTLVSYKSSVKELYFITSGQIEVLNAEHDEINKQTPILFLPQYSYFGDY